MGFQNRKHVKYYKNLLQFKMRHKNEADTKTFSQTDAPEIRKGHISVPGFALSV